MSAKFAIVTGATSGIGLEVARGLVMSGYNTVIVARNEGKAALVQKQIQSVNKDNSQVYVEIADLASLESLESLAARLISQYPQTSLLVNNAGVFASKKTLTKDNLELDLAVNHLAPFLLSWRLLPLLRQNSGSRIVNVNSDSHERVKKLQESDLEPSAPFSYMGSYSKSKLASMFTTLEFAKRIPPNEVTFNAVHPGVVGTNIANLGGPLKLIWAMAKFFLLSPQQGADTPLWVATAPELAGTTGCYYKKRAEAQFNPVLKDAELGKVIWNRSLKLAKLDNSDLN